MNALVNLAQNSSSGGGIGALFILVIYLALIILVIAGMWKTFTKAGQPGWACIIPIVNQYFLLKIVGRPWWWLILMFIPIINIIIAIIVSLDLAKSFGKGVLFAIGLILLAPIFFCILGFGSAEYQGPAAG
ncbi:MAG: signal peptidase I [Planctomycetota bacterium]|nr:MAG: signal peptidase I [Planctomycetota bacterium]